MLLPVMRLAPSPGTWGCLRVRHPCAIAVVMEPQRHPPCDRDERKLGGGVYRLTAPVAPSAVAHRLDGLVPDRSRQDSPPRVVA